MNGQNKKKQPMKLWYDTLIIVLLDKLVTHISFLLLSKFFMYSEGFSKFSILVALFMILFMRYDHPNMMTIFDNKVQPTICLWVSSLKTCEAPVVLYRKTWNDSHYSKMSFHIPSIKLIPLLSYTITFYPVLIIPPFSWQYTQLWPS